MRYIIAAILISAIAYLWFQVPHPPVVVTNQLTVKALDIGQGDSIYIRLSDQKDILIDTGPDDRVVGQLGQSMPIGDREIELIVLTHNHLDHIGGLKYLAERYQIDQVWISGAIYDSQTYVELLKTLKAKAINVKIVKAGDLAMFDESSLLVLFPVNAQGTHPDDQHDATVVTKLSYRQFCAIFTGDLNFGHEATILQIVQQFKQSISCPLLKVIQAYSEGTEKPGASTTE